MKHIFIVIFMLLGFSATAQKLEWFQSYNGFHGLKNSKGEIVVEAKYSIIRFYSENYAACLINKKWGFLDVTGKEVIKPQYEDVGNFSEGLAYFVLNGKAGFIDKKGKVVIPAKYNSVGSFKDGISYYVLNDKYGFIDASGKEIAKALYDDVGYFTEGLAYVKQNGKYGYINKNGKLIIPVVYDKAANYKNNIAVVKKDGRELRLDKTGKEIKSTKLIPVENKDGFWEYKNDFGATVIASKFYVHAQEFSEGLAAVTITAHYDMGAENLTGFIDTTGKLVIPTEWKFASDFNEGVSLVGSSGYFDDGFACIVNGNFGFIDKQGKLLFPLIYCHRIEGDGQTFKVKGKVKIYTDETNFYFVDKKGNKVQ